MRKVILVSTGLTLAVIAGLAGFYMYQTSDPDPMAAGAQAAAMSIAEQGDGIIGTSRPDFSLPDVTGQMRNISEWDGKVVAINFWATWCPPCIKEIPEFIELQHKYGEQGLQFIGIALQRPEEVTEFMAEKGMNYPVLAGEMEVIKIAESYGNEMGVLPYTVIVDREGRIYYAKRGPLAGEAAEAIISELL